MNHMALHPDKTKFLLVTTRQKRQNIVSYPPPPSLPLNTKGNIIGEVQNHRVLEVTIDSNLAWIPHVNTPSKKIST